MLSFAGTASPMDFNGMVRHYYLRREPHRGDLRVNLIPKEERAAAEPRDRPARAERVGGRSRGSTRPGIKIVEVPPGPPVLSTLVAEVYPKPDAELRRALKADARHVRGAVRDRNRASWTWTTRSRRSGRATSSGWTRRRRR